MHILNVTFRNFRRLTNANLKLENKNTLLVGQNESGKSTILEGVYKTFDPRTTENLPRSFSKVRDEKEFEVKVFISLNKNDLINLLIKGGLTYESKDNILANQPFVFTWTGREITEAKIFQSKWEGLRERYGDNERYELILTLAKQHLVQEVIFIRPDEIINHSEAYIKPSNQSLPNQINLLNYLYYLQENKSESFSIIHKTVQQILKDTNFDLIKNDSRIEISIIKYFRGQEKRFTFDEMSDGNKKVLSILLKIFVYNPQIIILDEPDSSLHSNLVRALIAYLKSMDLQILIASHNEILINEFNPKHVRHVYSISTISSKIKDYERPDLTQIFADLGLNLKYKKSLLLSSELIILLEGDDDVEYLSKLLDKSKEGERVKDFNIVLDTTGGNKIIDFQVIDKLNRSPIPVLLVRDGDEMESEEKDRITSRDSNRIHIWKRREIENYVLSNKAILNTLRSKVDSSRLADFQLSDVDKLLEEIGLSLINKSVIMTIYNRYKRTYLSEDQSRISDFIRKVENKSDDEIGMAFIEEFVKPVKERFEHIENDFIEVKKRLEYKIKSDKSVIEICPGKDVIKLLSEWCKSNYQVEVTFQDLLENIPIEDIDQDFKYLVDKMVTNCSSVTRKYLETFEEIPNDQLNLDYKSPIQNNSEYLVIATYREKIFLAGKIGIGSGSYTPEKDFIAIGDYTCRDIKFVIPLNERTKIIRSSVYDIKYEPNSNVLVAVSEIHLKNDNERYQTAATSLLIVNITTGIIKRVSFAHEPSGEKEGNADQLVLYMNNHYEGTIFFSMIYFNGGSGLYCIKYNFKTNKIISRKQHRGYNLHFSDPGPRSLFIDSNSGRLYFLVNYQFGPYVFVVCCRCNKIIEKISIPVNNKSADGGFTLQSSHDKHAIALNYTNGHLLVIENNMLFELDPFQKTIKRIKSNQEFKYIVSNPRSKRTYLIATEYDEDAENPYSYTLYMMIEGNFRVLFRFDNEITVNDITLNEDYNSVYVVAKHNYIENEHSLWKFNEIN